MKLQVVIERLDCVGLEMWEAQALAQRLESRIARWADGRPWAPRQRRIQGPVRVELGPEFSLEEATDAVLAALEAARRGEA